MPKKTKKWLIIIAIIVLCLGIGAYESGKKSDDVQEVNTETEVETNVPTKKEFEIEARHHELLFSNDFDDSTADKMREEEERVLQQVADEYGITKDDVNSIFNKVNAYRLENRLDRNNQPLPPAKH